MTMKLRTMPIAANVALLATLMVTVALGLMLAYQQIAGAIVTEEPRRDLPIALDGQVWAVEQVGDFVVVGGNFTRVQVSRGGPIVNQAAIYAYHIDSGTFLDTFRPTLNRNNGLPVVRAIQPTRDGTGLYIAGTFGSIDDGSDGRTRIRDRIALLELETGRLDRNFARTGLNAQVNSLAMDRLGRLYAGGNFTIASDLAPGRPPINQPVRGLARLDPVTGAFDTTWRYETHVDIGRAADDADGNRTRSMGVSRILFAPDGRNMMIAHRGAEIRNANTGAVLDSPGLAWLTVFEGSTAERDFKVLYTDPDDPNQDFYHAGQCNGRGVQIRDIAWSDGAVFAVQQGADLGPQCDTVIRVPLVQGGVRPDWVARAFDSVFSIEIVDDDVYIGGHFRYLVNNTAPSPYPGVSLLNNTAPLEWTYDGQTVAFNRGEGYTADPTNPADGGVRFNNELVQPGFVFESNQFGVLDANTGFADPSFNPGSNAQLGVLALTAIDRGLLIGQDNDRINDVLTGTSAFLDDTPTAGLPQCSVSLNAAGAPVVTWQNLSDVRQWNISVNGNFTASVPGTSSQFVDDDAARGERLTYQLRYRQDRLSLTDDCGTVEREPVTLTCSVRLNGDGDAVIDWNDAGWGRVSLRRDGGFLTGVDVRSTSFTDTPPAGTSNYAVRAFVGGEQFNSQCGSVTVSPPPPPPVPNLECSVRLTAQGNAIIDWNDAGWSRVSLRRDGDFLTSVAPRSTTFSDAAPTGTSTYSVRAFVAGQRAETECGTINNTQAPTASVTCTSQVNGDTLVLTWNDEGARSYQIRTNGAWTETLNAGTTRYETANTGDSIVLRYRLGGTQFDVSCN